MSALIAAALAAALAAAAARANRRKRAPLPVRSDRPAARR